jgi:hypothetical protein
VRVGLGVVGVGVFSRSGGVAVTMVTPLRRGRTGDDDSDGVHRVSDVTEIAGVGRMWGCGRWRRSWRKPGRRAA